MTQRELMQALLDGEKVRKKDWDRDVFIEFRGSELIYSNGMAYGSLYFAADEWEIYPEPEPKKFLWAYRYKDDAHWFLGRAFCATEEEFKDQLSAVGENEFRKIEWAVLPDKGEV